MCAPMSQMPGFHKASKWLSPLGPGTGKLHTKFTRNMDENVFGYSDVTEAPGQQYVSSGRQDGAAILQQWNRARGMTISSRPR